MTPEQKARVSIDALLVAAGWYVCNKADGNFQRPQALRQKTLIKVLVADQ